MVAFDTICLKQVINFIKVSTKSSAFKNSACPYNFIPFIPQRTCGGEVAAYYRNSLSFKVLYNTSPLFAEGYVLCAEK
jgi:hypothetical protein